MRRSVAIFILFHLVFLTSVIQGQQPDTLSLHEVEVSGTRIEKPQGSIPVQRLDILQLQRLAGNTVADALRHFAGTNVRDYGGIGGLKTVQVRSLGAQHTGVFVDGIPMSDAATGQIDLGRLLIDLSEDLSLTTGGNTDLFRPARWFGQASTLALQTKTPDNSFQGVKARIGLRTGSFGLMQPYALIDMKTSGNSLAQIGLRYLRADGTYLFRLNNGPQPGEWLQRRNSDVESMGMQGRVIKQYPKFRLDYGSLFDRSSRGLPGAVTLYNPQASQRLTNADLSQHLRWSYARGSSRHQLMVRHALMQLRYIDPDFLNPQGHLEQNYLQQELYFSQLLGTSSGNFRFSVSNDITLNTLNAAHLPHQPRRLSWHQLLAAGWQNNRWETTTHLLWLHVSELKPAVNQSKQHHPLSPGLSVAWRTGENTSSKIRFMLKDAFRLPSFNDMYYNIVGNPSLVPERASMFNLGWVSSASFRGTEWSWQLDAFHSRVRDKIIAVPTKNLFVWSMRNIGRVYSTGLEASLSARIPLGSEMLLTQHFNYTFQHATDQSSPSSPSYGQQIQYLPVHAFNGYAQLSSGKLWAALSYYFNSERYFLPENLPMNRLPAWSTFDFILGYDTRGFGIPMSFKAETTNLLNHQYEIIRSFPMPGRALMITFSATIR